MLEPGASEALRIAAVTHDIERAFAPAQAPPDGDPASPAYTRWHQDRSARVVARWLAERDAPPALAAEVAELVRIHETGGGPAGDLLQAADSVSFLETQIDLFTGMVRDGRLSESAARRKFQWMYDRVRLPRASELAAPMLASALARLDGLRTEEVS